MVFWYCMPRSPAALIAWYLLVMLSFLQVKSCQTFHSLKSMPLAWSFPVRTECLQLFPVRTWSSCSPVWALEIVSCASLPCGGSCLSTHARVSIQLEVQQLHGLADPSVWSTCTGLEAPPPVQEAHGVLLVLSAERCGQSGNWTKCGNSSFPTLSSGTVCLSICCPLSEGLCFIYFI